MHRRNLLKGAVLGACVASLPPQLLAATVESSPLVSQLSALERRHGGQLGVAMLDTGSGRRIAHRGDQRFLMCSTFKVLAVAAVLARVDQGRERLDRRIVFDQQAVLAYAPLTGPRVGAPGMTLAELCHAAITLSDNTAANLLLQSFGGPSALTAFMRSLGDTVTRLDRSEPELNDAAPGDERDTTTPQAMLDSLQTLLLGDALSVPSREQLNAWLRACTTGQQKLRAGLPSTWTAGDKTGSGSHEETNDIAIIWPPRRKPLLVTAYYAESDADAAGRSAVLAQIGRIVASI
jgi:beta-lactamase class A